jgi:hypothetical protein
MSPCKPFQSVTFTLQIDSSLARVPLDEVVANVERQPTEVVSPFKDERSTGSELNNDAWH